MALSRIVASETTSPNPAALAVLATRLLMKAGSFCRSIFFNDSALTGVAVLGSVIAGAYSLRTPSSICSATRQLRRKYIGLEPSHTSGKWLTHTQNGGSFVADVPSTRRYGGVRPAFIVRVFAPRS